MRGDFRSAVNAALDRVNSSGGGRYSDLMAAVLAAVEILSPLDLIFDLPQGVWFTTKNRKAVTRMVVILRKKSDGTEYSNVYLVLFFQRDVDGRCDMTAYLP